MTALSALAAGTVDGCLLLAKPGLDCGFTLFQADVRTLHVHVPATFAGMQHIQMKQNALHKACSGRM